MTSSAREAASHKSSTERRPRVVRHRAARVTAVSSSSAGPMPDAVTAEKSSPVTWCGSHGSPAVATQADAAAAVTAATAARMAAMPARPGATMAGLPRRDATT